VSVYGIDPGGTIGVARVRPDGRFEVFETEDLMTVLHWIVDDKRPPRMIVAEDFIASGPLSADGKHTIKQIGALETWCNWFQLPFTVQVPQARLSAVTEATNAILEQYPGESAASMRNAISALAHIKTWKRRNGG
jgi:hypothetical protein